MLKTVVNAQRAFLFVGLLALGAAAIWIAVSNRTLDELGTVRNRTPESVPLPLTDGGVPAGSLEFVAHSLATGTQAKFPIIIRRPDSPPRIDLGLVDASNKPITAACSTCHATRPANSNNRSPADLDEFHQSMTFAHGKVSCLSCHNPDNYDTLRLADGSAVEYADVMNLCAQCHGPQTRDYHHGAHGGMNGYWDRSRGPQTRNNCVDCHDPHAPSFPAMKPTFKPRDRFLDRDDTTKASSHE